MRPGPRRTVKILGRRSVGSSRPSPSGPEEGKNKHRSCHGRHRDVCFKTGNGDAILALLIMGIQANGTMCVALDRPSSSDYFIGQPGPCRRLPCSATTSWTRCLVLSPIRQCQRADQILHSLRMIGPLHTLWQATLRASSRKTSLRLPSRIG